MLLKKLWSKWQETKNTGDHLVDRFLTKFFGIDEMCDAELLSCRKKHQTKWVRAFHVNSEWLKVRSSVNQRYIKKGLAKFMFLRVYIHADYL